MKRQIIVVMVLLFVSTLSIFGQTDSDRSVATRKAELNKKLADLNEEEIVELERLIRLKELDLARLKESNDRLERQVSGQKDVTYQNSEEISEEPENTTADTDANSAEPELRPEENGATTSKEAVAIDTGPNIGGATGNTSRFLKVNSSLDPEAKISSALPAVSEESKPNAQNNVLDCERRDTFFKRQICRWAVYLADKKDVASFDVSRKDLAIPVLLGHLLANEDFSSKFKDEVSRKFLIDAEDSRTDKQVGAGSGGSGTTSLAVKGGVPAFFNWATERGAATSSVNGTTMTFRFNPVGFLEAVTGEAPVTVNEPYENKPFLEFLKKTSIGASFDISRGDMPNMFTGSGQQLSALNFRFEILNRRNNYKEKLGGLINDKKMQEYIEKQEESFDILFAPNEENDLVFRNSEAKNWIESTDAEIVKELNILKAASYDYTSDTRIKERAEKFEEIITKSLQTLNPDELVNDEGLINGLTISISGVQQYVAQANDYVEDAKKGTVVTLEYTNNREINLPDTSNIRFIYEKNILLGADFTFNGSLSFYNSKPTGMNVSSIRDFNFATQLDIPLNGLEFLNRGYLTFAGKYQRLNNDLFMFDGTVLPDTKGDIWVGQFKLSIPIAKGIRLPISATFANRTDLIKEQETRGNFGLTFDVDTLFTMLTRPQ